MQNLQETPQSEENLEVNTLVDTVGVKELAEIQNDPSIDITKESKENGIAQKMFDTVKKNDDIKGTVDNCTFALKILNSLSPRRLIVDITYPTNEGKNKISSFWVGDIRENVGESHGINFDEFFWTPNNGPLNEDQQQFIEDKLYELNNNKTKKIETKGSTEKTPETKNSEVLTPEESNLFNVINTTERPGVKSCFENIQKNNLLQKALSSLISQWITDKTFNDYLSSEKSTTSIIVGKDAYRFRILWTNTQFKKEYTDYKDLVENWLCPKKWFKILL